MRTRKIVLNIIVLLTLALSVFVPTNISQAGTQVEVCDPVLTAGTPYVSGGKVVATSSVVCASGASVGVTFTTQIKVFRKSDHVWLYDTLAGSSSCVAPCTSSVYNPGITYDSTRSYYTWTKVTVNGTTQYTTDGSNWLNY